LGSSHIEPRSRGLRQAETSDRELYAVPPLSHSNAFGDTGLTIPSSGGTDLRVGSRWHNTQSCCCELQGFRILKSRSALVRIRSAPWLDTPNTMTTKTTGRAACLGPFRYRPCAFLPPHLDGAYPCQSSTTSDTYSTAPKHSLMTRRVRKQSTAQHTIPSGSSYR
jgi:hypothetical protein